jgi:DHA3 family macrolide efflux protein-like MFS transporter
VRFKLPQILEYRAFRDLWLGQSISQLGDAFYFVTFMFMAEKLTGDITMVGIVGALEAIPYLLFSAYAGVAADRFDRRRIMWLSDVVCGVALGLFGAVLVFDASPPAWLLAGVAFVLSTIRCFFLPAKSAAIPNLIPGDKMMEATAFSMTTQSLMPLIGLAFSASLMAPLFALSPRWFFFVCVALNALSFFGSAVYIARLPKIQPERKEEAPHALADFKLGWKFLGGRRDLVVFVAMLTVFRLFVSPFFVVHVAANKAWFGGKPSSLAWFEFSFFAGMILASPIVGKMKIKRPTLAFSYGLAAVGAFVAAMAISPYFWPYVFWNVLCGLAIPYADIPMNAYLQLSVPDEFRGRVNSVVSMIGMGVMPIGMLLAGVMVEEIGIKGALVVMGVGMMVACLAGPLDRAYRNARMPETDPVPKSESEPDAVRQGMALDLAS